MALSLDVRDLMKTGSRLVEDRAKPVRVAVFVEIDAADELIEALRVEMRPATATASLQIEVAEDGKPLSPAAGTDVLVAAAGSGSRALASALALARGAHVPVVVVSLGPAERAGLLADALTQPTADLIVSDSAPAAVERLGDWLSDNIGNKRMALAHNFAFVRHAVADEAVNTTAWQNAIVGVVTPIPGADMPIMTANQIKMLLQIAAAYGQPLNAERVKELAAIVAGGYLLRGLAREALSVVPVLGWAIKGGIAYSGTVVMGKTAVKYFDEGADISEVTAYFRGVRDRAAAQIRGARKPFRRDAEMAPGGYTKALPGTEEPAGE